VVDLCYRPLPLAPLALLLGLCSCTTSAVTSTSQQAVDLEAIPETLRGPDCGSRDFFLMNPCAVRRSRALLEYQLAILDELASITEAEAPGGQWTSGAQFPPRVVELQLGWVGSTSTMYFSMKGARENVARARKAAEKKRDGAEQEKPKQNQP
jgi:hypothetical protein